MPTDRHEFEDDLDYDPSLEDMGVDELLAAVEEDHPYQPPRRRRRDRTAWRRIESRRDRRRLKEQLADWEDEDYDYDRD